MKDTYQQVPSQVPPSAPPPAPIARILELFIWWGALLMVPFISWGSVPLLTGVFALLVALAFLLRIRRSGSEGVIRFQFTPLWIPWVIVLALGGGHLVWSPVPYSSLMFLIHFSLAGVLYFLLLQDPAPDSLQNSLQDSPQDPPPNPAPKGILLCKWILILGISTFSRKKRQAFNNRFSSTPPGIGIPLKLRKSLFALSPPIGSNSIISLKPRG